MWNSWATLLQMGRRPSSALPGWTSKCTPSPEAPAPPPPPPGTAASQGDPAGLFQGPVCLDHALPPTLQCASGHLVCSSCRPKLSRCPACRGPLGSIRNPALEKVAGSGLFPCKHAAGSGSGCESALPPTQKAGHEEPCAFRQVACPCPGAACRWQGSLDGLLPHLAQRHASLTALQGEDILFLATGIHLPGAADWLMLQACFGSHFLLVLKKQEKCDGRQHFFAAVVQLLGTRAQADRFAYRLELRGHRRRMTWEDTPRSIHEGIATALLRSDCLIFDTRVAHLFAENGNLGIHVIISLR